MALFRLVDGFAKKMADQFFDNFQQAVEGPSEPVAPEDITAEAEPEKKKGWLGRVMGGKT